MGANMLQSLVNSAISYIKNDTIKVDEDKAAEISNKLGKISAEIEMAALQIDGAVSEAQPIWTGLASEKFFSEISEITSEAKAIGERVKENRNNFEAAVSILMNADDQAAKEVAAISDKNIFMY